MMSLEYQDYFYKQNCASVCDYVPLFFSMRPISDGKPLDTCSNVFIDEWISDQGLDSPYAFTVCIFLNGVAILSQIAAMKLTF